MNGDAKTLGGIRREGTGAKRHAGGRAAFIYIKFIYSNYCMAGIPIASHSSFDGP